ncbi:MAG: hypothetical protein JWL82_498, partial [Parcubacteria group bacterium]|nr:hypothetical protein [Parcubacteria group bacterium]
EHLVVGDEAVKEWVRIRELGFWVLTEGKFESLVEKLGRLVLKPAPEEPAIE